MSQANHSRVTQIAADASHWRIDIDADDIAWLCLDKQDSSTNVLSRDVLTQFDALVRALAETPPAGR